MNQVLFYFPNSDMRRGHAGLAEYARKEGKNVAKLEPGQFMLFVNRKKDQLKLYSAGNCVTHFKSESGRIDMRIISEIPRNFSGGRFDYKNALRNVLERDLSKRGIRL